MPRFPIQREKWTGSGYHWLSLTEDGVYHPGEDINTAGGNADLGEKVFCHDFGTVVKVDRAAGGYGNQVLVEHEGHFSRYAHLQSNILVKEGDLTTPFTQIGTLGNSGAAASAHLHFELPTKKLISYLKSIRAVNWFRFYPNNQTKEWVEEHYLNPNTNCTRNIKVLTVFYGSPETQLFKKNLELLKKWVYENSSYQVKLEVDSKEVPRMAGEIPWVKHTFRGGDVGEIISYDWLRYWIMPLASGYDVINVLLPQYLWRGNPAIGYSSATKHLGLQVIVQVNNEGEPNPKYAGFCDSNETMGVFRHELAGHALYSLCAQGSQDKTHQYEAEKHIEKVFQDQKLYRFEGWKPKEGIRMFAYSNVPSGKTQEFSGIPTNGRVYRTSDYRMFFLYENGWKQIDESQFESAIKSGHDHVKMSVEEGNGILQKIGGSTEPYIGTSIEEEVVNDPERKMILVRAGWVIGIPSLHIRL